MSVRAVVRAACLGALIVTAFAVDRTFAQGRLVVWPTEAITWMDVPGIPGGKQAVLWGDPMKGAYGALKLVPGGTTLPMHIHTRDSRVIVTKGTIVLEAEGKKTTLMPGSYVMFPGGLPHAAMCQGTMACEYFEEMSGAFDSMPAKK